MIRWITYLGLALWLFGLAFAAEAKVLTPLETPAAAPTASPPGPVPGSPIAGDPAVAHSEAAAGEAHLGLEPRGTMDSPVIVRVLPDPEAAAGTAALDRGERDLARTIGWLVTFAAALAVIALIQLAVFGLQAYRLGQTVRATRRMDRRHTQDMQNLIAGMERALRAFELAVVSAKHAPQSPTL